MSRIGLIQRSLQVLGLVALSSAAAAQTCSSIDNDVPFGTFGHFSVCVRTGGESFEAWVTGTRADDGLLVSDQILYEYYTLVDVGTGGQNLVGTAPVLIGDDEVQSSGSLTGAQGNTIQWTATSSIPDGGDTMTTVYTFTAVTGTLGELRLFQYLDEDVLNSNDDFFYTRGSQALGDLELFTIDDTSAVGVSHGGAYAVNQGLANSTFAGWVADTFKLLVGDLLGAIKGGFQPDPPTGFINGLIKPDLAALASTNPYVGAGYGPADIVSALAWDADPGSTTATILTTLGGVPSAANQDPVAVCFGAPVDTGSPAGNDITVDADAAGQRLITLDASGSFDPDDDPLSFTWLVSDAQVVLGDANAAQTTGLFPLGSTTATVTVTDGKGGVDVCDVVVTVQDATPPTVLCTTDRAFLWPPKHNMVPVQVFVVATAPGVDVLPITVTVRSDEPDDATGNGDGKTTGDVDGADGFSAPVPVDMSYDGDGNWTATVLLRAERAGGGDGRKYTIDATAVDAQGNLVTSSCCVAVPHSKKYLP